MRKSLSLLLVSLSLAGAKLYAPKLASEDLDTPSTVLLNDPEGYAWSQLTAQQVKDIAQGLVNGRTSWDDEHLESIKNPVVETSASLKERKKRAEKAKALKGVAPRSDDLLDNVTDQIGYLMDGSLAAPGETSLWRKGGGLMKEIDGGTLPPNDQPIDETFKSIKARIIEQKDRIDPGTENTKKKRSAVIGGPLSGRITNAARKVKASSSTIPAALESVMGNGTSTHGVIGTDGTGNPIQLAKDIKGKLDQVLLRAETGSATLVQMVDALKSLQAMDLSDEIKAINEDTVGITEAALNTAINTVRGDPANALDGGIIGTDGPGKPIHEATDIHGKLSALGTYLQGDWDETDDPKPNLFIWLLSLKDMLDAEGAASFEEGGLADVILKMMRLIHKVVDDDEDQDDERPVAIAIKDVMGPGALNATDHNANTLAGIIGNDWGAGDDPNGPGPIGLKPDIYGKIEAAIKVVDSDPDEPVIDTLAKALKFLNQAIIGTDIVLDNTMASKKDILARLSLAIDRVSEGADSLVEAQDNVMGKPGDGGGIIGTDDGAIDGEPDIKGKLDQVLVRGGTGDDTLVKMVDALKAGGGGACDLTDEILRVHIPTGGTTVAKLNEALDKVMGDGTAGEENDGGIIGRQGTTETGIDSKSAAYDKLWEAGKLIKANFNPEPEDGIPDTVASAIASAIADIDVKALAHTTIPLAVSAAVDKIDATGGDVEPHTIPQALFRLMGPGLLDKDDLGGIIGNDWIPGDPEIINDLGQRGPIGATPDAYNKLLALGNRLESGFDPNNEVEGQPNTLVELVDETKELIGILSNQNPERKGQKKKGAKNKPSKDLQSQELPPGVIEVLEMILRALDADAEDLATAVEGLYTAVTGQSIGEGDSVNGAVVEAASSIDHSLVVEADGVWHMAEGKSLRGGIVDLLPEGYENDMASYITALQSAANIGDRVQDVDDNVSGTDLGDLDTAIFNVMGEGQIPAHPGGSVNTEGGIIGNDWDSENGDNGAPGPIGAEPDIYGKLAQVGLKIHSGFDLGEGGDANDTLVEAMDLTLSGNIGEGEGVGSNQLLNGGDGYDVDATSIGGDSGRLAQVVTAFHNVFGYMNTNPSVVFSYAPGSTPTNFMELFAGMTLDGSAVYPPV